ncbi:MAG: hypothetical protein ACPGVI_00930 [Crocinitomicaceae bacterium]
MRKGLFVAILFLASCSSKDEQFCTCLTAGEELNEYTQQFFEKEPSQDDETKISELKAIKTEACKDYQMMAGDKMRQKKADCEN